MIVTEPSRPSPSARVYDRSWNPAYWRGSLDEIVGAARAALDEIQRQHRGDPISESVHLDFSDESRQDFGSLDGLQEVLPSIDITEVDGLWIGFSARGGETASVRIQVSDSELTVCADGSEAFASGMVATIKSRLAGGADAGEQQAVVPLRFVDWFLLALIPVSFIGSQVLLYSQFDYTPVILLSLMGLLMTFPAISIAALVVAPGLSGRRPPRFVLVQEGEQFPDEGNARSGPVWSMKAWFERHPAVALLLVLVLGALLGRAADLIKV